MALVAPSQQITIGSIGVGSHGLGCNLRHYLTLPEARVIAVCDVDGIRLRKAAQIVNKRSGNQDCLATKDFREILARSDIDAVMISTPDHWHTPISIMAVGAGKDVQCEKPTLTIDEGKLLIREVCKHKRILQTSTEDRSIPVYHRMAELFRNGRIGKLVKIEVILSQQPTWPGDPTPNLFHTSRTMICGWGQHHGHHIPKIGFISISDGFGITQPASSQTGELTYSMQLNGPTTPKAVVL